MRMTVSEWFAARRPLWAIYPTTRLSFVVLLVSVLWIVPGTAGIIAALLGLSLAVIAVGTDFVLLPGRHDIEVTRDVPSSLGLGDPLEATINITSHWRRRVR